MTHADYMAEAGPFTADEAKHQYQLRRRSGERVTLEDMLRQLPRPEDREEFTVWFVNRQEETAANPALLVACEAAALDLESLDEDSDLLLIAARLREAVRLAREGER